MSRASIPPVDAAQSPRAARPELEFLSHPLPAGMRDLLPAESEAQGALLSRVMWGFELCGYQRVSLPAFEYASVLERGLGPIEASSVLRFVEPDTGEVLAMRPDVTPQVARLVATRLTEVPGPVRLAYRGSVLRRLHERARHDQQILQAGIEFVGAGGLAADIEVLRTVTSSLRGAGLTEFVVDLGHGAIASSLLSDVDPSRRGELLEALSQKDVSELARRAAVIGVAPDRARALVELVALQGGLEVFERAHRLLGQTPAAPLVTELERVARAVTTGGLAPNLVVDLGETRTVPYYTGVMFQVLAEGPGQAVASGGRYDALYGLFGDNRPAAGAAVHIDHLRWALGAAAVPPSTRVLVLSEGGGDEEPAATLLTLDALRAAGIRAASLPVGAAPATPGSSGPLDEAAAFEYARVWRFVHILRPKGGSSEGEVRVELSSVEKDGLSNRGVFSLSETVDNLRA